MFNYFGSKSKLVDRYPRPRYERIIEPFAGSAAYALTYYGREIWINDVNAEIYSLWQYICNEATIDSVRRLPEPREGEDLRDYKQLSLVEISLLRQCSSTGIPGYKISKWSAIGGRIARMKKRLVWYLPRIKHWRITNCSYNQIFVNPEATWFIDPPYQGPSGRRYRSNHIDYTHLGCWSRNRNGQSIVCEGTEGNWLPFKILNSGYTGVNNQKTIERIWTNEHNTG